MACVGLDLEIFHRSNETLLLLLEISLIAERQRRFRLFQHLLREFRRGRSWDGNGLAKGAVGLRLERVLGPHLKANDTLGRRLHLRREGPG